ncbi:hypothetical protein Esti_006166 [Eimeria stiedai]
MSMGGLRFSTGGLLQTGQWGPWDGDDDSSSSSSNSSSSSSAGEDGNLTYGLVSPQAWFEPEVYREVPALPAADRGPLFKGAPQPMWALPLQLILFALLLHLLHKTAASFLSSTQQVVLRRQQQQQQEEPPVAEEQQEQQEQDDPAASFFSIVADLEKHATAWEVACADAYAAMRSFQSGLLSDPSPSPSAPSFSFERSWQHLGEALVSMRTETQRLNQLIAFWDGRVQQGHLLLPAWLEPPPPYAPSAREGAPSGGPLPPAPETEGGGPPSWSAQQTQTLLLFLERIAAAEEFLIAHVEAFASKLLHQPTRSSSTSGSSSSSLSSAAYAEAARQALELLSSLPPVMHSLSVLKSDLDLLVRGTAPRRGAPSGFPSPSRGPSPRSPQAQRHAVHLAKGEGGPYLSRRKRVRLVAPGEEDEG